MQLSDILYVLFRHKWKITIISVVAILASVWVFKFYPEPFGRASMQSVAKLYIKYVMDNRESMLIGDPNGKVRLPDQRGENVIATEMEILRSYDLAQAAAKSLTDKELVSLCGSTDYDKAARAIRQGLVSESAKGSSVIQLSFSHSDSDILTPVLNQVITNYFALHQAVHRPEFDFDYKLQKQKTGLQGDLEETEKALSAAKTKANVIGLEDSKKEYSARIAKLQEQLLMTTAELEDRKATGEWLKNLMAGASQGSTNNSTTNGVSERGIEAPKPVPAEVVRAYKKINSELERLQKRDDDAATVFTAENKLRQKLSADIAEKEAEREKYETTYPDLLMMPSLIDRKEETGARNPGVQADLISDGKAIAGLERKAQVLSIQLSNVLHEASQLVKDEVFITELQRKRDLLESAYRNIANSLEQANISKGLDPGRVVNIVPIQIPTNFAPDREKIQKIAAMVLFGGLALAFGLAFLLEFYVDRSLKNPLEVEAKTGLPVYISIPLLGVNGSSRALNGSGVAGLLAEKNGSSAEAAGEGESKLPGVAAERAELAPWDSRHAFRPFYESLRDRLINFFEVKNMIHKPKLVAVTSVSVGAGVSTIAAGLAASLSETGEGNVLLVDMNLQNGAAHHFHKGDLAGGIDEALTAGGRDDARVQENLYVVSERDSIERLPGMLPKRFKSLVPKLKASDYDYIIFDMPPVTQVSITPRLAKFMDMVFLVAESEKSDRDAVKRAGALLAESKTNVGVVLNKRREYMPKRLQETV